MSKAVKITGEIDVAGKSVSLSAEQDGVRLPQTFVVGNDHMLTWHLRDAKIPTKTVFEGFHARIRFVEFPNPPDARPLVEGGKSLDAAPNGVIAGGKVKPDAFNGQYRYAVELVGSGGVVTSLQCSWVGVTAGAPAVVTGMGGIKREGGPGG